MALIHHHLKNGLCPASVADPLHPPSLQGQAWDEHRMTINILGVNIDERLSLRSHIHKVVARTRDPAASNSIPNSPKLVHNLQGSSQECGEILSGCLDEISFINTQKAWHYIGHSSFMLDISSITIHSLCHHHTVAAVCMSMYALQQLVKTL